MEHPYNPDAFQANDLTESEAGRLVETYMGLVVKLASKFHVDGMEQEDLIQEGLIGLLDAIRTYQLDRDTSFQTYASTCIRNRILKAAQSAAAKKHSLLNQSLPLEESIVVNSSEPADPELLFLAKEKQQEMNRQIKILLSSFEKETLFLYLQGYSYDAMSKRLHVPKKSVDNALVRIRKKLKFLVN